MPLVGALVFVLQSKEFRLETIGGLFFFSDIG